MKLFTRIKISYGLLCIVPLMLICVLAYAIGVVGINSIEKRYDITNGSMEIFINPLKAFGSLTTKAKVELDNVITNSPEKLDDSEYLDKINSGLKKYASYMMVQKNGQNVYSGIDETTGIVIDDAYLNIPVQNGNIFIPDPVPAILCCWALRTRTAVRGRYAL